VLRKTTILELFLKLIIVDVVVVLSTDEDHQVIVAVLVASVYRVNKFVPPC
jgi:hypothetical protein